MTKKVSRVRNWAKYNEALVGTAIVDSPHRLINSSLLHGYQRYTRFQSIW